MKQIPLLALTLSASLLTLETEAMLAAEFITGFETGVFLREDKQSFEDY